MADPRGDGAQKQRQREAVEVEDEGEPLDLESALQLDGE